MTLLWLAPAASLAASMLLTRKVCDYARSRLVDVPNARSSHRIPTPRGGGLAIAVTFSCVLAVLWLAGSLNTKEFAGLFGGGALVAGIGFWDDHRPLPARWRLLVQSIAALWTVSWVGSLRQLDFGVTAWNLGGFGYLLTLIGLVWLTNLNNFMDGIDGLAGVEAIFAGAMAGLLLVSDHMTGPATACFALAACAAGFLVWNWPPAKVFLGDVGSGYLGFMLGGLMLLTTGNRPGACWIWVVLLGVFITDSTVTLFTRLVLGQRWYEAHRTHAYQHAASRWGHSRVTKSVCAINVLWLCPLAIGAWWWPNASFALSVTALAPLVWVAFAFGAGVESGHPSLGAEAARNRKTPTTPMNPSSRIFRIVQCLDKSSRLHGPLRSLLQITLFAASGAIAFVLRFDLFHIPASNFRHLQYALPIWVIAKSIAFRATGLQRGWWQCVSMEDVYTLVMGNILGSAAAAIAILSLAPPNFPRSIYFLDFLICLLATTGVRVFSRAVTDLLVSRRMPHLGKLTLIYGAGMAGRTLLREIRSNVELEYKVCGFLDDDPRKAGVRFHGVTVHGSGAGLGKLIRKYGIEQVLIALPSASGKQMAEILERCHAAGVKCRTMPALGQIIKGRALTSQIRDVAVEDLLGRAPVTLESNRIRGSLRGQVVMVTGAGGSIGSEICRQAARFGAPEIVAYEVAETALFHLDREIRRTYPHVVIHPEIGSIQNRQRLAEVMAARKPSIVYHAAAYKHVPMMEAHLVEAIRNNIFGTYEVAMAAAEHGVREFVMISSDKAVRPTNVMGATKRVAELIINSLQNGATKYMSVRFGNVLGSNGSAIPLFKEQIAAGGPVTITHPEMQRYFMTIPEAVQLVLQASTLGNGGEVFVLDMGQPVRIIDLAKTLILLSGLRPGVDIDIEFTGPRPGEKLFEELSADDDTTIPTGHHKISVSLGRVIPRSEMLLYLQELEQLCASGELGGAVLKLREIVPDYKPSPELQRQVLALESEQPHGGVLTASS